MEQQQQQQQRIKMAQTSLLQGKRFYCREWVFHKVQHCLQEKSNHLSGGVTSPPTKPPATAAPGGGGVSNAGTLTSGSAKSGSSWGVLLVGGPGSGKTAVCTELLWPTSAQGAHRGLQQHGLAFHFCRADDSDTLCVGGFVRGLVGQICRSGQLPGYEEKVRDPTVQSALQPGECERNPTEAFKRYVALAENYSELRERDPVPVTVTSRRMEICPPHLNHHPLREQQSLGDTESQAGRQRVPFLQSLV